MKKVLLFLLSIVFLFGLTSSMAKAQTVNEQPGDIIYYQHALNGTNFIWEADLMSEMKFKRFEGIMPSLSNDGTKLAYYNKNMKPSVFDVESETTKVISKAAIETANMQPVWSPSKTYLAVNGHTSTNNMFSVITMKGKEKVSFNAIGKVYWINNNVLVYTSLHDVATPRPRGDGGGMAFGVSKINVKTGKITVLANPDQLTDYQLFDYKNGKIRFTKYLATSQSDWEAGNLAVSYWTMNKTGKNIKKAKTALIDPSIKISTALKNTKYQNYMVEFFGNFESTNWQLFTLRKSPMSDAVVFIMHYPQKSTLNRIVKGEFPTW